MHTRFVILTISLMVLVPGLALSCDVGRRCITDTGEPGTCQTDACVPHNTTQVVDMSLTIVVKYPDNKLKVNGSHSLYIRGSSLGLTWKSGRRLRKVGQNTWTHDLSFRSSISGVQCVTCATASYLPDSRLQFRVFVDDKTNMLGPNFVIDFPVSMASTYFNENPRSVVYPWFYSTSGNIQEFRVQSNQLGERNLSLYLPPSYNENTLKSYPVFMVFDFVALPKEIIEAPIFPHKVAQEYVIVGFDDYGNKSDSRTQMLTQSPGFYWQCINGTFETLCDGCLPQEAMTNATELQYYLEHVCSKPYTVGGGGDNVLDFLLNEALPKANDLTKQRLHTKDLGVLGYSLGGLMACYAAWTRPYVFRMAACQSPSFWWPMDTDFNKTFGFLNVTLADANLAKFRTGNQRIYIDAGSEEDDAGYYLTSSTLEVANLIAANEEYTLNKNLWLHIGPGETHSFTAWFNRYWRAVSTLLPVRGDLDMPQGECTTGVNNVTNHANVLMMPSKYAITMPVALAVFLRSF